MTAHTHTTIVPGCYRCELSADEVNPSFDVKLTTRLFTNYTRDEED